jgi:hypothetical protein
MRWCRIGANIGLTILLLFDVTLGFQYYSHGWPTTLILTDVNPGVKDVKVSQLPFTKADAWILAMLIVAHALLGYLAWHFRK